MTFIDGTDSKRPVAPQPSTQDKFPVGFFLDLPTYKTFQAWAHEVYNMKMQDPKTGVESRFIEHDDVNEFLYFAATYTMQQFDTMKQFQGNPKQFGALLKDMVSKLT